MRNKLSKLLSVFLCAGLICLGGIPAVYAVEPLELNMEGVVVIDGGLAIFCNTNAEPLSGEFSVTLGNSSLAVLDVATVEDVDPGVSYIFLVDVSGSIKQTHLQAIKDTVASVCEGLTENDNVSIFAFGSETYTQPFVSDPEDIQAQFDFIDTISKRREDTSLYEGIFTSLAVLDTHADCRAKKVLVVFSDGEEDIIRGITIDEAAIKITDSRTPVYTVAIIGKNPPNRYVETAKVLGSFARLSAGGRHYIHSLDKAMSEEIAKDILGSVQNGMIVLADLTGFSSDGNDMMLRLELTVPDVGKAGDGYLIPTAGLSVPVEEPSPAEEPSPPEQEPSPREPTPPAETGNGEDEPVSGKSNNQVWIIGGASALVLAVLAVFLLMRRKKPVEAPPAPEPISTPTVAIQQPPVRPNVPQPPPGKPKIALRLTKIGLTEEQVFRAEFAGELVVGRDPDKASLPFPNDDMLSGRHCSISYEPDGIVLRDLQSTNGTFVNGVPIQERHILENDDVLLIGSMELRVNWETI